MHQVSTQRSVAAGIPDVSIQMSDPGNNPDPLKMVSPVAACTCCVAALHSQGPKMSAPLLSHEAPSQHSAACC